MRVICGPGKDHHFQIFIKFNYNFSYKARNVVIIFSKPNHCNKCGNETAIMEDDKHINQTFLVFNSAPRRREANVTKKFDYF